MRYCLSRVSMTCRVDESTRYCKLLQYASFFLFIEYRIDRLPSFFFLNDPPTPKISTLPLHAPLPICHPPLQHQPARRDDLDEDVRQTRGHGGARMQRARMDARVAGGAAPSVLRGERRGRKNEE